MTTKVLELRKTRELVRKRGLDETTFLQDEVLRETLAEYVPDPDELKVASFYVGLSLGCELAIATHESNPDPTDHTRRQILLFRYAQCLADAASDWCMLGYEKEETE